MNRIENPTFRYGRTSYTVEYKPRSNGEESYELRGPRGAKYTLWKNVHHDWFFAVNTSSSRVNTPFKGSVFIIKDGALQLGRLT